LDDGKSKVGESAERLPSSPHLTPGLEEEMNVLMLLGMGFSLEQAKAALARNGGLLQEAVNDLLGSAN